MLINLLLNFVVLILGSIFHLLPQVVTLPTIGGFDIDGALVSGMGSVRQFFAVVWPLQDMWYGFLTLMGYYTLKLSLIFLLGHRAPGNR